MSIFQNINYAIVDVETTGGSAENNRIIEIAVLKVVKGEILDSYSTLVNPQVQISPFIEQLTGIRNRDLPTAPTFREIAGDLVNILDGAVFTAHNVSFDYSFVKTEFKRQGINFSAEKFCTMRFSRLLFPDERRHSLDSVIARHAISCTDRHRALGDARVLYDFLKMVDEQYDAQMVEKAFAKIMRRPVLPAPITMPLINALPTGQGIYIFRDSHGVPLYIGRGKNVRDKVLNHFRDTAFSAKASAIAGQVTDIEAMPFSRELSVMLAESELIRQLRPRYNRRCYSMKKHAIVKYRKSENEYTTVGIKPLDSIVDEDLSYILGVFPSKKSADVYLRETANEHGLCLQSLGLEKGNPPCSNTQVGRCRGACTGVESVVSFNTKFEEAFRNRPIKRWPFSGPILIQEARYMENGGEAIMINNWRFHGIFCFDDSGKRTLIKGSNTFDYNIYKILVTSLFKSNRKFNVRTLSPEEVGDLAGK